MHVIIKYNNLSNNQMKKVFEFLKGRDEIKNEKEMIDNYYNEAFDYGNGCLFYFKEDKVVASICVVLEVAKKLGNSFIIDLVIDENIVDIDKVINTLIKESISLSKEYGATDIRLGMSEEVLDKLIKMGYIYEYKSLEMVLNDTKKRYNTLSLKEVNIHNIEHYVNIYNDSFSDMPHGTVTKESNINKLLNKKDYYCFFVCDGNKDIGFMEVSTENNKGIFDIGLCKRYRGNNYGYRLLESAIDFLVKKSATVNLIVIEDNKIAYEMYKKRGFIESKIINYWMKLEA